jgi:S-adenosylmethionine:tRNA ribosyltransferase-isomerase
MKTNDFFFDLPAERIAQYPSLRRGESRLLFLNRRTGESAHHFVKDAPCLIPEGSLLVFNDSRVRKARVYGLEAGSGKQTEFLFLRPCRTEKDASVWEVMTKKAEKKINRIFLFDDKTCARLFRSDKGGVFLQFDTLIDETWFEKYGHIPLPPYIKRHDELSDSGRYQTIYAKDPGSVAAPTAGLHFTEEILKELEKKGIERVFVTLHVGLGTFLPVRTEEVQDHKMHEEFFHIDEAAASKIEEAKNDKRKIIAVGTTTLRVMESAWHDGKLRRGNQSTGIFIYGDYQFKTADALWTNFHTPESTLLMLVCSFAGKELIMETYRDAVLKSYNFFSYGDAMFIV